MRSTKIVNKTDFSVDGKKIANAVNKIVQAEERKFTSNNIVVVFVGVSEIRDLNKEYLKKDTVTDVLSFFYNEEDVLGEVIVCPEYVFKQATKKNKQDVLYRTIIHGVLHLLGYTHDKREEEKIMEQKTEDYIKELA